MGLATFDSLLQSWFHFLFRHLVGHRDGLVNVLGLEDEAPHFVLQI